MNEVIKKIPMAEFNQPIIEDSYTLKPILRGKWQGGISNIIPTTDPNVNPDLPYNNIQETLSGGVHSILYWLNKDDPRGSLFVDPNQDPQFKYWEYSVQKWVMQNGYSN